MGAQQSLLHKEHKKGHDKKEGKKLPAHEYQGHDERRGRKEEDYGYVCRRCCSHVVECPGDMCSKCSKSVI